jgi:ectoine hydroxylase-related dioxygenase (phytanoyl-CoA dioxygenase family)
MQPLPLPDHIIERCLRDADHDLTECGSCRTSTTLEDTLRIESHFLDSAKTTIGGDVEFLSAVVVHATPGAAPQAWHTDLPRTLRAGQYSIAYFVALTDNCGDAPTEFIVDSARTGRYDGLLLQIGEDLPKGTKVCTTSGLRRGEAIGVDPCTIHRGGASKPSHDAVRSILVVTFVESSAMDDIDRVIQASLTNPLDNDMRRA